MILVNSKEVPFHLDIKKGRVCFIGDLYHCSNYAGRFLKTNNFTTYTPELSVNIGIPPNEFFTVELYYGGEYAMYDLPTVKDNTKTFVVVTDDAQRASKITDAIYTEHQDVNVVSVKAFDSDGYTVAHRLLQASDAMVLKQLEFMFLSDTTLHRNRNEWRALVDTNLNTFEGDEVEDEVPTESMPLELSGASSQKSLEELMLEAEQNEYGVDESVSFTEPSAMDVFNNQII